MKSNEKCKLIVWATNDLKYITEPNNYSLLFDLYNKLIYDYNVSKAGFVELTDLDGSVATIKRKDIIMITLEKEVK